MPWPFSPRGGSEVSISTFGEILQCNLEKVTPDSYHFFLSFSSSWLVKTAWDLHFFITSYGHLYCPLTRVSLGMGLEMSHLSFLLYTRLHLHSFLFLPWLKVATYSTSSRFQANAQLLFFSKIMWTVFFLFSFF